MSQAQYQIAEIFESIQGEGPWQGRWCTFIRFAGCNLACDFCDTDHGTTHVMYEEDLVQYVAKTSPDAIVLTGGEPCLQINRPLIIKLQMIPSYPEIAVETNGTRYTDALSAVDHITLSPKLGGYISTAMRYIPIQELRVIVTEFGMLYPDVEQFRKVEQVTLSPIFDKEGKLDRKALDKALYLITQNRDKGWKLSVQLHKLIGVI